MIFSALILLFLLEIGNCHMDMSSTVAKFIKGEIRRRPKWGPEFRTSKLVASHALKPSCPLHDLWTRQGWHHAAADATTIFFAAIAPAASASWIAVLGSENGLGVDMEPSLLSSRLRYQPLMQLPGLLAQPVQQQLLGDLRFLGFQGLRFGGMLLVSVDTLCCILFYMPDVHIIYIYIIYVHTYMYNHLYM